MIYTSREVIKLLTNDGWVHKCTRGSHAHYTHPTKFGKVTVPLGKKDIPKGTFNNIMKQAGLK